MQPEPQPEPENGSLPYLPIFLDVRGRAVLVVGEGTVADAKAAIAARAGAVVRRVRAEAWRPADLDGAVLAIDAGGDAAVTRALREAAAARHIQVNVVDRPAECDFIMPAILDRSPVVVAVSTGGAAPALARIVRQRLELAIPASLGRLASFTSRLRGAVGRRLTTAEARIRFWDAAIDGEPGELAMAGREAEAEAALERLLEQGGLSGGSVALVGAGPGDPDLLTVAAVRAIQKADVILYDHLVGPAVLDLSRREVRRILVGKRAGRHSMSQAAINELMLRFAREGARVVRLKGGDPLLFGRAGEELEALRAAGFSPTVIPGVTAALGAAAQLGLPLSLRGVSRSVHFVTASVRAGDTAADWASLAGADGTLAVYMGRDRLAEHAAALIAAGLSADTPAAAVENATLPESRAVFAPLHALAHAMAGLGDGPTLVLIGAAVAAAPGWAETVPAGSLARL